MTFKIASWNVNSLKVRLPHLMTWVQDNEPTIIALQETKTQDPDFPSAELKEAGFHCVFAGQKAYNGVAILSREKIDEVVITDLPGFADTQRRLLAATINDVRVINLYVPNGQSVTSDKFQYKLQWLQSLHHFLEAELKTYSNVVMLGDFNIAPSALDVHDPAAWEGQVLCTDAERQAFNDLLQIGMEDSYRVMNPTEQGFSWWDYRLNAFKRNLGLRIDHILTSDALMQQCKNCYIDKIPRAWERPSDHAPIVCEF